MKRFFSLLVISCILLSGYAEVNKLSYNTVDLDSPVYRIIEIAQIKGIIPTQSEIKPYSVSYVVQLLNQIKLSDELRETEKADIDSIIKDFERIYLGEQDNSFRSVLQKGFFKFEGSLNSDETGSEKRDLNTSLVFGAGFSSKNVIGYNFSDGKVIDSKNRFTVYAKGNLFNFLSYNVNASLHLEKVDPNAYLDLDYPIDVSANYFELPRHDVYDFTSALGLLWGISSYPELNMSFFDEKMTLRFATVKRDWGPTVNNLGISGSASPMSGFEFRIKPFDWFEYTLMHASLTKFALETFNGVAWPSDTYGNDKFDNLLSIHRLDLKFGNLNLGLYENVVWRKRFELAYLNPFAIYMVIQNEVSDYDNMMFGFDLSYTVKRAGKFYFAFALDEMSALSIKTFFVNPRHIMAVQLGGIFPARIGDLSTAKIQLTYIPPFYGSHYIQTENPWGSSDYYTMYVNKGRSISYPLNPDSLEIMLNFDMNFFDNYSLNLTIKDQMRSAQFAVNEKNGMDIFTPMVYSKEEEYQVKNFFKNIWNNIIDVDISVTKKFTSFPFSVTAGLQFVLESRRDYNLSNALIEIPEGERGDHKYDYYNPGVTENIEYGDWNSPSINTLGKLTFSIYL